MCMFYTLLPAVLRISKYTSMLLLLFFFNFYPFCVFIFYYSRVPVNNA